MFIVPDIFKNQNNLYHYTTADIAMKHILFDKRLRISPRKSSIDPIENLVPQIFYPIKDKFYKPSNFIIEKYDEFKEKANKIKQISFCQNEFLNHKTKWNLDNYGFMKPRMWDQYGDNYKGICLVFDKEKINIEIDHFSKEIEYKSFNSIYFNKTLKLKKYDIKKNDEKFKNKKLEEEFKKLLFYKHIDYVHENEYRIMTFSDNKYDYIDISKSITCFIVSDLLESNFYYSELYELSKKSNIPMFLMPWSRGILFPEKYEEYLRGIELITNMYIEKI